MKQTLLHRGIQAEPREHCRRLGAEGAALRIEPAAADILHQTVLRHIDHVLIGPIALGHVAKEPWCGRRGGRGGRVSLRRQLQAAGEGYASDYHAVGFRMGCGKGQPADLRIFAYE